MPIKVGSKTYKDFAAAVRAIMRAKGWDKKKASAYVAAIEKKQKGR